MGSSRKESMKVVPAGRNKCVWMEAKVISYKLCDNTYDCSTCSYDHAMDAKVAKQKLSEGKMTETWVEMMLQQPASQRKCRYTLTGEIGRKLCPNSYACGTCSFDSMMQSRLQTETLPVQAPEKSTGFDLADGFYYHEGHTWARPEYGGRVRVGINDFAQKLVGKKGRIELPTIGHEIKQGKAGFVVKRNDQSVQILAPVDGVITHINNELLENPELINESPYEKGWLFTIEPSNLRKNLKGLYFGDEAKNFISDEREQLFSMANDDMRVAADGGESSEDIFADLEDKKWAESIKKFLKS